ncbi:MAG: SCO1664 family protein [Actinobacteria bacterium]|nr:SCO1664 family protein [Actinomycetota bacterium]MCB9390349.1 SCO1664 family protein [Acidimicrobiia bacterium]
MTTLTIPPELPLPRRAEVLSVGGLEPVGRLEDSSNFALVVLAELDGDQALAVWKAQEAERPLWDFPAQTLCQREVAAYEVSNFLGFDLVPFTAWREGPFGMGMVQAFIPHDPSEHFGTLRDDFAAQFRQMCAFDLVINNADRKAGHALRGADDHIWGIDHGLTFNLVHKVRTVIWDYIGEPIPSDVRESVGRAAASLDVGGTLHQRLAPLLTSAEISVTRDRAQAFVAASRFPEPTTDYPYPWPLI